MYVWACVYVQVGVHIACACAYLGACVFRLLTYPFGDAGLTARGSPHAQRQALRRNAASVCCDGVRAAARSARELGDRGRQQERKARACGQRRPV